MAELIRQVGASSDDCWNGLSGDQEFQIAFFNIIAGWYGESDNKIMGSGMRFTNITIPKGATIVTAYLTLRCREGALYNGTVVNTRISAEDVDDALTFLAPPPGKADFEARFAAHTTARVDWDNIPVWTSDTDYNSPEIKTVIKEIVDRAGWASGNDIVIFWEDFDDRSTHALYVSRTAYSYDLSTTYAPKLVIEYTLPGWANIAKVNRVASATIAKIDGVAVADIAKVNGVAV